MRHVCFLEVYTRFQMGVTFSYVAVLSLLEELAGSVASSTRPEPFIVVSSTIILRTFLISDPSALEAA